MTIEEEEPPFLYREEGAGIVTPGGLTEQDRADGLEEMPYEQYHIEQNLSSFLSECCILKPSAQTSRTDVYKAYDAWSTYTENTLLITNRILTEMLKRRGIERGGSGGIYFIGLELR
jgi:hypothetical protein